MKINLKKKIILVTGASRGIGKAIALALGNAGATVALHFNRNEVEANKLAMQLGNNAKTFQADLAKVEEVSKLWQAVCETYGKVDILVNNAGISLNAPLNLPTETWIETWDKTLAVNLRATGILCREAVLHFEGQGGGKIINIASRAAFRGDTQDFIAYAASKGGIVSLTRSIARAFGKQHIVAFTIAPGFIQTDMAQDFIEAYGEAYVVNDLALPKLTQPADVAPTIVFLASGLADHATGCTIDINAGSYVH